MIYEEGVSLFVCSLGYPRWNAMLFSPFGVEEGNDLKIQYQLKRIL